MYGEGSKFIGTGSERGIFIVYLLLYCLTLGLQGNCIDFCTLFWRKQKISPHQEKLISWSPRGQAFKEGSLDYGLMVNAPGSCLYENGHEGSPVTQGSWAFVCNLHGSTVPRRPSNSESGWKIPAKHQEVACTVSDWNARLQLFLLIEFTLRGKEWKYFANLAVAPG